MAQPMFGSALGGMTPDELLRRLQMVGGPSDPFLMGQADAPDQPGVGSDRASRHNVPPFMPGQVTDISGRSLAAPAPPVADLSDLPLSWQSAAASDKTLGPRLAPPPGPTLQNPLPPGQGTPLPSFTSSPQDQFDTAPGSSKASAPPAFGPNPGAAAPPAFTPFNFPPPAPYEPTNVPNAIRTGMYNPAGASPWDRGMTATSAEEEHRLRQQAAYNNVLDLIRPGGLGMPGSTGPIVGLQPHEIAALTHLGGQQAENLFKGRQLAEQGSGDDRKQMLEALKANQQAQTQLGVADITGKAHVAGAQAAHSPAALKAQFAAQYLAAGKDPLALGEFMSSLERHLPGAGSGLPNAGGGVKGIDTDAIAGGPNVRAAQAIGGVKSLFGTTDPTGGFKLTPDSLRPENIGKLVDAIGNLPPEAQTAAARQLLRGDLGAANDVTDAVARHFAQQYLMAQPPPIGGDLQPPGQYNAMIDGMTDPLVTLNAIPGGTRLARGGQSVATWGNLPYNQLTVGGRKIPFSPSSSGNDMRATFGIGESDRKLAPDKASKAAAVLRELMKLNTQPK